MPNDFVMLGLFGLAYVVGTVAAYTIGYSYAMRLVLEARIRVLREHLTSPDVIDAFDEIDSYCLDHARGLGGMLTRYVEGRYRHKRTHPWSGGSMGAGDN